MIKRFVVGTSAISPESVKNIVAMLEKEGFAWWKYLPNFWLVRTTNEAITAASLRDDIRKAAGSGDLFIMQIHEDVDWASWGSKKNAKGGKWTDWLFNTWAGED